jgi:F-type H+-transporting ATPase subunit b
VILAEEVNELWKWPNFLLLAVLLGYLIKKQGGPFLEERSRQIRESLDAGKKAKAEADALAASVEKKFATLDREISELRAASQADLERETQRIRRDAEAEIKRVEQQTAAEIESLGKRATIELKQFAASLAMDLAEQKIRSRMSPDVQATLLNNFAGDIAKREGTSGSVQ